MAVRRYGVAAIGSGPPPAEATKATVRDAATGGFGGGIRQQLLLIVAADPKDSPARSKYPGDRNQLF